MNLSPLQAYDSGRDAWKDALECRVQSADLQMAIAGRLRRDLQVSFCSAGLCQGPLVAGQAAHAPCPRRQLLAGRQAAMQGGLQQQASGGGQSTALANGTALPACLERNLPVRGLQRPWQCGTFRGVVTTLVTTVVTRGERVEEVAYTAPVADVGCCAWARCHK